MVVIDSDLHIIKKYCTRKAVSINTFQMNIIRDNCLKRHNEFRAIHNVPPLELSKQLCDYAQDWASTLAAQDRLRHRQPCRFGENCYMMWTSNPQSIPAEFGQKAVDSWYAEISDYVYDGQWSPKTGHFTQVVWKNSRYLGVGVQQSKSGRIYLVANYDPAGNVQGQFNLNVFPPKK